MQKYANLYPLIRFCIFVFNRRRKFQGKWLRPFERQEVIFITFLMLFSVMFAGNKNGIYPSENILFRRGNHSFRTL